MNELAQVLYNERLADMEPADNSNSEGQYATNVRGVVDSLLMGTYHALRDFDAASPDAIWPITDLVDAAIGQLKGYRVRLDVLGEALYNATAGLEDAKKPAQTDPAA